MKLSPDAINGLKPDPTKRREIRDDNEPGLWLRITPAGVRTWVVRYVSKAGDNRRQTLGRYPTIGLARARVLARKAKGDIAEGIDVVSVEKEKKEVAIRQRMNRLDSLADAYFADAALGIHRPRGKPKRASTLTAEKDVWERCVNPQFGNRPVTSLTRREIIDYVGRETRSLGPAMARHCYTLVRQLLNYAVMKEIVSANIALNIGVAPSAPRDRILSDDELRTLWQVFGGQIEGIGLSIEMRLAMRMALLTLQRGGEVVGMRWSEIDRQNRLWTMPAERMKGKRPHRVPLSEPVLALLEEADEIIGGREFVFQSPRAENAMDRHAFSRAFARFTKQLKIPRATPHDFRRTGATNITGERIGIPRFIVAQVLAHADHGVTGMHYDLNDYLVEKRRALDAWAALLIEIVTGTERPANVLPLARAG